jgi:hypothetical protein
MTASSARLTFIVSRLERQQRRHDSQSQGHDFEFHSTASLELRKQQPQVTNMDLNEESPDGEVNGDGFDNTVNETIYDIDQNIDDNDDNDDDGSDENDNEEAAPARARRVRVLDSEDEENDEHDNPPNDPASSLAKPGDDAIEPSQPSPVAAAYPRHQLRRDSLVQSSDTELSASLPEINFRLDQSKPNDSANAILPSVTVPEAAHNTR